MDANNENQPSKDGVKDGKDFDIKLPQAEINESDPPTEFFAKLSASNSCFLEKKLLMELANM